MNGTLTSVAGSLCQPSFVCLFVCLFFSLSRYGVLVRMGRLHGVCLAHNYGSFSRDVIIFENPKLKSHESFYPHQA